MMMLSDAHIHLFAHGYHLSDGGAGRVGDEVRLYESICQVHQISDALVIGYEGAGYEGNNDYIAALARKHRWVHPLAYLSVTTLPTPRVLNSLLAHGFRGVALYVFDLKSAQSLCDWEAASQLNAAAAIVSLNIPSRLVLHIVPFLEKLKDCHVLLSHLGLPGQVAENESQEVIAPLIALSALNQVGVKASGFYACGDGALADYPHSLACEILAVLVENFGYERLYWGSDFVPALSHVSFAQTLSVIDSVSLGLSEKAAIFGGNLRRILQIHEY